MNNYGVGDNKMKMKRLSPLLLTSALLALPFPLVKLLKGAIVVVLEVATTFGAIIPLVMET
jgi:hypothetical protein